jgi:predicted MFS family arabinose efflux permease
LLAGIVMTIFGVHAVLWVVITTSLRQRLVPGRLLGRVEGTYNLFRMGATAIGAILGGLLAHAFGITAPFWFAGLSVLILAAVTWRLFAPRALARGSITR